LPELAGFEPLDCPGTVVMLINTRRESLHSVRWAGTRHAAR
jgi:hypothetical protein